MSGQSQAWPGKSENERDPGVHDWRVQQASATASGEQHAGGNGCSFEVGEPVAALRQLFGGHVEPGEATHAVTHEVDQCQPVPAALQAFGVSERRGGDSERYEVGERFELTAERRLRLPPARDPAVGSSVAR